MCITGGPKQVLGFMGRFPKTRTFISLKVLKMNKNQPEKEGTRVERESVRLMQKKSLSQFFTSK